METAARTVLITGSSSGIGRAAAEYFTARGWNVAATARDPGALGRLAGAPNLAALHLDVTSETSVREAIAAARKRFGTIDVLVNNAGYGLFGPLEGAIEGELEAQFETNVFGAARVIRHLLPVMRAQRSGTVVNISSIGGLMAAPFGSAYYASKFALEGLSESLQYELSLHGIRVKLVEPAHFKTGFIGRSLHRTRHASYQQEFDNFMQWVNREDERAPGPQAVAKTIYRAATDESDRLRYPVRGRFILALNSIVPDGVVRSLMAGGMTRRPRPS
jgi:NAD(P)-dependent dehydrogenase (short-subunit alcohol dehydrogenase family)